MMDLILFASLCVAAFGGGTLLYLLLVFISRTFYIIKKDERLVVFHKGELVKEISPGFTVINPLHRAFRVKVSPQTTTIESFSARLETGEFFRLGGQVTYQVTDAPKSITGLPHAREVVKIATQGYAITVLRAVFEKHPPSEFLGKSNLDLMAEAREYFDKFEQQTGVKVARLELLEAQCKDRP